MHLGLLRHPARPLGIFSFVLASIMTGTPALSQSQNFDHTITDGVTSYQASFELYSLRSQNFEILVQQDDGSFASHTAEASKTYIGRLRDVPGASASAVVRNSGQINYHVLFEDGTEWIHEEGSSSVLSSPLSRTSWAQIAPTVGGAGSQVSVAEVGADLPFSHFQGVHASDVEAALEMIEHSIMSANLIYLRDTSIEHQLGRVIIRGSQSMDPYQGLSTHGQFLTKLDEEWTSALPSGTHDLALVIRETGGAGVAYGGAFGSPAGYSSNDTSTHGDFSRVWRHEVGHNWKLGHYDGGYPEGNTINSGNSVADMSGPEQRIVSEFKKQRAAFLDLAGPFGPNLPPNAGTDLAFVSASEENVVLDILANDHDVNGHSLELLSIENSTSLLLGGQMEIAAGAGANGADAVLYTPPSLNGATSMIDRFTYRIRDSSGQEGRGYVFVRLADFDHHYQQNFDSIGDGVSSFTDGSFISNVSQDADASIQGGALELTKDELWSISSYTLPVTNLEGGFTLAFRYNISSRSTPADIFSVNFGAPVQNVFADNPSRFSEGIRFDIVTYPGPELRLSIDDNPAPIGVRAIGQVADGQWHDVVFDWTANANQNEGRVTVTLDEQKIFDGISTSGRVVTASDMIAFGARTGGLSQRTLIDDIVLTKKNIPTGNSADEIPGSLISAELYPNPFVGTSSISLSVDREQIVEIDLHDSMGRLLRSLNDEVLMSNTVHRFNVKGSDLAAGVYYVRIQGRDFSRTMAITKLH